MNIEPVIKKALELSNHRLFLGKNMPICPNCKDEQVQLTNHFTSPAEWKCRVCNHKFCFEP